MITPPILMRRQNGAVLVVSLLLMLVLTILALAGSQTTRLQERLAWNMRDMDLSFQAAEAGLRAAEDYLRTTASLPTCSTPSSGSCYVLQEGYFNTTDLSRQTKSWWETNAKPFGAAATQEIQGVESEPRFVIEEYQYVSFGLRIGEGPPPGKTYYKSTAWGLGGTDTAQSVVESVFARD